MRIKWVGYFFIGFLAFLLIRTTFIAIVMHREYFTAATEQRTTLIPASTAPRGIIYDRNFFPLTAERAPHTIGYVRGGTGMGLQKIFDNYLKIDDLSFLLTAGLAVETAANGTPIAPTATLFRSASTRKGVHLTLDYRIQEIVQDALSARGDSGGAAVVIDAETGDILAMSSTPVYSPEDIAASLGSSGGEFVNRAIAAYDVGSLFKIVTTSAAVEEGVATPESRYNCVGFTSVSEHVFHCNNRAGHGELTLAEAFSLSCNIPFFEIGTELFGKGKNLYNYASKFGFGERLLDVEMDEAAGNSVRSKSMAEIANTAIGQGDFQATPLQIAAMIGTVVNGGKRVPLRLVSGLIGDDGVTETPYSEPRGEVRAIKPKTAETIKSMMLEAVQSGTGKNAMIEGVDVGGKTASAETGWLGDDGTTMTHGWFGGFFRHKNTMYVCVVLAEDGKTGSGSAVPIFSEIGRGITSM
ncbi:MAG: hypothetical protein LBL34_03340 [Clostridiales bacterium]|jgi:cell division protein FtsI/penicillin-binding protein 2|nr:hypothetical protein [Clostridiales bacterium]